MSSEKRARTRAIRAEMATSGTNYTRAAHAAPTRPAENLRAVCYTCRNEIPPRGGVIHISHREVRQVEQAQAAARARREAKAAATAGRTVDTWDFSDLMDRPDPARWQVHCDDCNPHNDDHCEGCYWIAVERRTTWAQLVEWTAHLSEKEWVLAATNWMAFVRATAHRKSEVGLICHPADQYHDA